MGQAKNMQIEADDRGYHYVRKNVCSECCSEPFLSNWIFNHQDQFLTCHYCGATGSLSVDELMPMIYSAVTFTHNDPSDAGVPREDGEWVYDDFVMTEDVLGYLCLEGNQNFIEDVADAILNDTWVEAPEGWFFGSHRHEVMMDAWSNFEQTVKYHTRYFFEHEAVDSFERYDSPRDFLAQLGDVVKRLGLIKTIPSEQVFHRVRKREPTDVWAISSEQLGAPPNHLASAGRMNPAGISYLYLAESKETAIVEVVGNGASSAVCAEFSNNQPITVLDLTDLPHKPSLFDTSARRVWNYVLFLSKFSREITKPIDKTNVRNQLNYVPTQVVSEYFAHVFNLKKEKIDGIRYKSSVHEGGINVVLFPHAIHKMGCKSNSFSSRNVTVNAAKVVYG